MGCDRWGCYGVRGDSDSCKRGQCAGSGDAMNLSDILDQIDDGPREDREPPTAANVATHCYFLAAEAAREGRGADATTMNALGDVATLIASVEERAIEDAQLAFDEVGAEDAGGSNIEAGFENALNTEPGWSDYHDEYVAAYQAALHNAGASPVMHSADHPRHYVSSEDRIYNSIAPGERVTFDDLFDRADFGKWVDDYAPVLEELCRTGKLERYTDGSDVEWYLRPVKQEAVR